MNELRVYLNGLLSDFLPDWLSAIILTIALIILWIFLGKIIILITKKALFRFLKIENQESKHITIAKLLSDVVRYVVWFIVGIVILTELNIDITPFLASAGVVGLAIGFGAQEIVKDFLSGFFLIFEGAIHVGDVIETNGFKGKVLEIGLRTTTIQNWKGEVKIVNNGDITSLINFSKADSLAIVDFGVAYDTNLQALVEAVEPFLDGVMDKYDEVIERPSYLGITELADSSINMRIIAKTKTMEHFQIERKLRKDLVEFLKSKGIEIPFPQVVIHSADL